MRAGYETGGRRREESNEGSYLLGPAVSTKRHKRFDPFSTLAGFRNSFGGDWTGLNGIDRDPAWRKIACPMTALPAPRSADWI